MTIENITRIVVCTTTKARALLSCRPHVFERPTGEKTTRYYRNVVSYCFNNYRKIRYRPQTCMVNVKVVLAHYRAYFPPDVYQ